MRYTKLSQASLIVLLLISATTVPAVATSFQDMSQEQIKTLIIVKSASQVTWPDEKEIDTFFIGTLSINSTMSRELQNAEKSLQIKNRPFRTIPVSLQKTNSRIHVAYIDRSLNRQIPEFIKSLSETNILVITEECRNLQYSMFNLRFDNSLKMFVFDINKQTIIAAGLRISNQLEKLHGKTANFSDLYWQIRTELDSYMQETKRLRLEILRYDSTLSNREKELQKRTTELKHLSEETQTVRLELDKNVRMMSNLKHSLGALNREIISRETALGNKSDELRRLARSAQTQRELIASQQTQLDKLTQSTAIQKSKIKQQQTGILISLLISAMLILAGFSIYSLYRAKRYELNAQRLMSFKEKAELSDQLRELNVTLEKKVAQQTESISLQNDELRKTNEQLRESERMKDLLSGALVHDIKNHIFSIASDTKVLSRDFSASEAGQSILRHIKSTCSSVMNLSANLLDIAKMEEGQLVVTKKTVDYAMLASILSRYTEYMLFSIKKIRVSIEPPAEPLSLEADYYLLDRVLQNLCMNAAMYTPENGSVKISFPGPSALRIHNSGDPIPEVFRKVLFEKYARVNMHSSKYEKGLGLFFCRLVMIAHGGSIRLESDDTGNSFVIDFSAQPEANAGEQRVGV